MENTLENKAKFFALHWGFELIGSDHYGVFMPDTWSDFPKYIDKQYLMLKPLSSISDYEAIETAKIVCPEMFQNAGVDPIKIERHGEWLTVWRRRNVHSVDIDFLGYTTCQNEEVEYKRNSTGTTFAIDYLRSRGYALPFMRLSVEELVNMGWVKLKGGNK